MKSLPGWFVILATLLLLGRVSDAFVHVKQKPRRVSTALHMGLMDLKPFHGGGSAKDDELEEQWRLQQEKLKARRAHLSKDHLKKKYHDQFEREVPHVSDEFHNAASKFHTQADEMWYEEATHQKKESAKKGSPSFKFPWQK